MKTISAKIQSSTPVTISKAASVLNKFLSAENGASQAVNAYLRRATASLDELVRLHSKSNRKKHKKHKSEPSALTAATGNGEIPTRSVEVSQAEGNLGEKKRKKEKSGDIDEVKIGEEIDRKKHKKRRRTDDSEVNGVEIGNEEAEEQQSKKKKRRRSCGEDGN